MRNHQDQPDELVEQLTPPDTESDEGESLYPFSRLPSQWNDPIDYGGYSGHITQPNFHQHGQPALPKIHSPLQIGPREHLHNVLHPLYLQMAEMHPPSAYDPAPQQNAQASTSSVRYSTKPLFLKRVIVINKALARLGIDVNQIKNMTPKECNNIIDLVAPARVRGSNRTTPLLWEMLAYFEDVLDIPPDKVRKIHNSRRNRGRKVDQATTQAEIRSKGIGSYSYLYQRLVEDKEQEIASKLASLQIYYGIVIELIADPEEIEELELYTRPYIYNDKGQVVTEQVRLLNRYLYSIWNVSPGTIKAMDLVRANALHMTVMELSGSQVKKTKGSSSRRKGAGNSRSRITIASDSDTD